MEDATPIVTLIIVQKMLGCFMTVVYADTSEADLSCNIVLYLPFYAIFVGMLLIILAHSIALLNFVFRLLGWLHGSMTQRLFKENDDRDMYDALDDDNYYHAEYIPEWERMEVGELGEGPEESEDDEEEEFSEDDDEEEEVSEDDGFDEEIVDESNENALPQSFFELVANNSRRL